MKHPDKILTTGQLLTWFEENNDELFIEFRDQYTGLQNDIHWEYLEYHYNCLNCNENLIQTPLSLDMFVSVKDGKVLEEPIMDKRFITGNRETSKIYFDEHVQKVKEYKQARKKILFEGFEHDYTENRVTYLDHGTYELRRFKFFDNELDATPFLNDFPDTIEELANQTNLIGTGNFWNRIFKQ